MNLDEALIVLEQAGYEVAGSFEQKVMEQLKDLCSSFTPNSAFDPVDVFEKTYSFYAENYEYKNDDYEAYKLAKEMIARYRFKKKWHEFK